MAGGAASAAPRRPAPYRKKNKRTQERRKKIEKRKGEKAARRIYTAVRPSSTTTRSRRRRKAAPLHRLPISGHSRRQPLAMVKPLAHRRRRARSAGRWPLAVAAAPWPPAHRPPPGSMTSTAASPCAGTAGHRASAPHGCRASPTGALLLSKIKVNGKGRKKRKEKGKRKRKIGKNLLILQKDPRISWKLSACSSL